MRIVFISDWFAERMGYAENCLPKAVASLGFEVHVIAANVQPYFDQPSYQDTYEPFIGPAIVPCETRELDGFTLHRLPHDRLLGRLRIVGLQRTLRKLRPDIVQTFEVASLSSYEAGLARPLLGYRLFLESHIHASVFDKQGRALDWDRKLARVLGVPLSSMAERCYAISSDAAEIAIERLGIAAAKVEVCSLGVDTAAFRPASDENERARTRQRLGFAPEDLVCIYTGRFAADKGPALLARAIARLGPPYRGFFVGDGEESRAISQTPGCVVHPFVAARDLPPLYQAADIGVWPKQESTSQLDAAACGLPLVISDRVHVRERIEGNGLTYRHDDPADLAEQLRTLGDAALRRKLGDHGARKMAEQFSWNQIAANRVRDYQAALA